MYSGIATGKNENYGKKGELIYFVKRVFRK